VVVLLVTMAEMVLPRQNLEGANET
jgi:hypothetical protein